CDDLPDRQECLRENAHVAVASRKVKDGTAWFGAPVRELRPLDPVRAREELNDLASLAAQRNCARLASLLAGETALADFLGGIFDLSPYLRDCARNMPESLEKLFDEPLEVRLLYLQEAIRAVAFGPDASEASIMKALRRLKREAHFLIALGDLSGEADVEKTVQRLSLLGENCVKAAVNFLLLDAHRQGKLQLPDPANPAQGCGWILLAM